jgi:hypothetical protein
MCSLFMASTQLTLSEAVSFILLFFKNIGKNYLLSVKHRVPMDYCNFVEKGRKRTEMVR